jgi:DNA-binding PadR family transcriptional regulator
MRILVYEYLETSLLERGLGGEVIEMAERRKVGNLMALSLLTLLTERPMYPYEMASELRGRGKDQSIKINWGSFYTVVQNLEKYGFIEAVNVGREGRQPERTTYQITGAGLAELKDWLRELLSVPEREYTRFEAALGEAAVLPPDEVTDLLRRRLEALDATIAEHQEGMKTWGAGLPRLFLIESEYHLALRQAEAEWVRGLLEEFTDGTFPGLDGWRHFHETGEFPADLMPLIGPGTAQEGGPQAAAREGDGATET